jgi:rifampicin phosphotransferase
VLGTNLATRRITDGQPVRVDGDAGTVTLLTDGAEPALPPEPARGRGAGRRIAAAAVAGLAIAVWRRRRSRHGR